MNNKYIIVYNEYTFDILSVFNTLQNIKTNKNLIIIFNLKWNQFINKIESNTI